MRFKQKSFNRSKAGWVIPVFTIALCLVALTAAIGPRPASAATSVFINEIHYDNVGTDTGEAIEIAGPAGTNLTGWSIVLYNGTGGASYDTDALSGVIPDQQNGFGTVSLSYPSNGIQNGAPDGIALVNGATVVQFLSYEGTFTATNGPANGMMSTDIGVSEAGTEPTGQSLRLSGTGCNYEDFTWNSPVAATFGAVNTGQTFSCGGGVSLSINDVTVLEGDSGTTTATFTVSLSSAAPAGGVTFNIATQDNSATVADNDYVMRSLTGQTIPEGSQTYPFAVTVNGDTADEQNETFFVNVTNVSGATIGDGQGVGTINNDDFVATPIHTIQGSGNSSPLAGQVRTTTGIVTGLRSNGFFIQAPDAEADANPNSSEGIFVFTSSGPPVGAAIGNSVAVMGTVQEFIPSQDLSSPPLTEIGMSPAVTLLSSGNPLPMPITLTAADTLVNDLNNLERFEGMRVHVNSLTVIAPTQGSVNEPSATSTSNGTFYGVITGVPRPFREPGLQIPDPPPAGSPCCIPRFDGNPERLRVDSDAQPGSTALEVTSGATVTNITGPLDYGFRTYTILPDAASPPTVSGNLPGAIAVPVPDADEFTVGSFNMERFFDTTNDPGIGEPVLTATAFNNRLNKASLAIRNVMRSPDILGVQEMENLTTLQAVANKLNNDAVAAGAPDPMYQGFLAEGNDVGGIDVGFLVKTSRVTVIDVTQFGKDTMYTEPGGAMALLNDRPPLVLRATIPIPMSPQHGVSPTFPITVIVNHMRSLTGVDDPADGNRVRTKRRAQAEFLADLIQTRQTADPNEHIISVGDYNAFQFNDGYVDSIGTVKGTPTPANEVVLASSDLVNPDLTDLLDEAPADQRYSFSFDGNAQSLDHELITSNLLLLFSRISYARSNTDFPESFRNDPNRPERLSDHDMAVAYFHFAPVFCSFTLIPTAKGFPAAGGDGSVAIIAHSGCEWTAVSNDSWIIITSGNSGSGNGTLNFTVRENLSDDPRTGTMTIAGETFTVTQDGAGITCSYSISPTSASFKTPGASTGSVSVTATAGCGWVATSNASWIIINSGSSGTGNGTVNYSVAANTGSTRIGTMSIAGQTFTVKQKGP